MILDAELESIKTVGKPRASGDDPDTLFKNDVAQT